MRSRVIAALASDHHADGLAAFFREVWDAEATTESVARSLRNAASTNLAEPGRIPPAAIVFRDDRIIGYCGTIPQRLWDGHDERAAYWVKGLMVLPEFRGGPVGMMVMKELARHLDLSTVLTVAPAARRLFAAVGYTDLGPIPNWVRPLRFGQLARRIDANALGFRALPVWATATISAAQRSGVATAAGGVVGAIIDAWARTARVGLHDVNVEVSGEPPECAELRALWDRARVGIAAGPVRDDVYLVRRYAADAQRARYTFVQVRASGVLAGVGVLRRPSPSSDPRLRGLRVATLSDAVFQPEQRRIGMALLGGVETAARAAGADAILCTSADPRVITLVRRQGYVRSPANIHFFVRDCSPARHWPGSLASWWLARGDGESDDVF